MSDSGPIFPWPLDDNRPVPFPLSGMPTTIKDLVGKNCRVVTEGDTVMPDFVPGSITIYLDSKQRIREIYVDPHPDFVMAMQPSAGTSSGG